MIKVNKSNLIKRFRFPMNQIKNITFFTIACLTAIFVTCRCNYGLLFKHAMLPSHSIHLVFFPEVSLYIARSQPYTRNFCPKRHNLAFNFKNSENFDDNVVWQC